MNPLKKLFRFKGFERALLALAGPLIVHNILFTLMGFVDSIMVGQLGEDTISAVGNAAQVQMFLFLLFAAIGQGGSILVAQYFGAKDVVKLRAVASTMVSSGFFIGLAVGLACFFGAETFIWLLTLGRAPEVVELGGDYLRIVSFSYIFMTPGNMVASALRSVGDTKTPVIISIVANLINIGGNFLLIFGIGPFPELGYQGAAISTLISQVIQGLWLMGFILFASPRLRLPPKELFHIHGSELGKIIKIGYPMSIDGFYWQGARIAFTLIFNALGSSAYAAYTIVRNLKGMATLPGSGLQTATMIGVGQELGKKHFGTAKARAGVGIRMSLLVMAIPALVIILLAAPLVGIYKVSPDTYTTAVICTMILGVSIFFTTINSVVPGILRAGGDTVVVMKYTLLSFVLVGGPLAFLFGIVFQWGAIGAFVGVSIEEVFKATLFLRRMNKGLWLRSLAR